MNWKIDNENVGCRLPSYAKSNFLPDYMVCHKPLLETTEVWTFYEKILHKPFDRFERETESVYNEPIGIHEANEHSGYQLPCEGDSGSGNWAQQNGGSFKYVLVGINAVGSTVCGWYSVMEKINNQASVNWIKKHIELN